MKRKGIQLKLQETDWIGVDGRRKDKEQDSCEMCRYGIE